MRVPGGTAWLLTYDDLGPSTVDTAVVPGNQQASRSG